MKFNINHYVKVKLTDLGKNILIENDKKLHNNYPTLASMIPKEDEDGYSEFQLWELMETFGEHCYCGADLPFDVEIIIEEK